MRVVVIRHAKSDYPPGVADHDRPLAERGRREAPAIGRWLGAHFNWSNEPPTVLVSTAARAQQTWSLAAEHLSSRWTGITHVDEPRAYEASVATLRGLIQDRLSSDVILVAHNPGLEHLVGQARSGAARDAAARRFPTSAIAVLETEDSEAWRMGNYTCVDYVVARD